MSRHLGSIIVVFLALSLVGAPVTAVLAAGRGADGHFEKRESSHFVLLQDVDIDESFGLRGSRRFEQQLLETLESGYALLDARLGLRPRRPIAVVVYDPAVFDQRFTGLFRFPAAGFYQGTIHIRGDVQMHVQLVRVLHHELLHAALDDAMSGRLLPGWLNEGLAEWFESRAVGKRLLSAWELEVLEGAARGGGLFPLSALSTTSFAGFGEGAARLAYLQSYGFFEHLARRYGERSLAEFCNAYIRTGDLESAFRRAYRADLARLDERFRAELSGRNRR